MKMPTKGEVVYIENGGAPLFVGASDLGTDDALVLLKYRQNGADKIIEMSYDEWTDRRVRPEQLPDKTDLLEKIHPVEP